MNCKLQLVIEDEQGRTTVEEVMAFSKGTGKLDLVGLSLVESKLVLKQVQSTIIQRQADGYSHTHRCCPQCQRQRRIKGNTSIQYRTLLGL